MWQVCSFNKTKSSYNILQLDGKDNWLVKLVFSIIEAKWRGVGVFNIVTLQLYNVATQCVLKTCKVVTANMCIYTIYMCNVYNLK